MTSQKTSVKETRAERDGMENGPRYQVSFREKRNMAGHIAIVSLFIVLILFSLYGCIAVNINRATQECIQAMQQRENICTVTD